MDANALFSSPFVFRTRPVLLKATLTVTCAQNIQAVGVVVADVATDYSHWTAVESLSEWCAREGVVCCFLFT